LEEGILLVKNNQIFLTNNIFQEILQKTEKKIGKDEDGDNDDMLDRKILRVHRKNDQSEDEKSTKKNKNNVVIR
jgi:hypothetical protein